MPFKPNCLPLGIGSLPHKDSKRAIDLILSNNSAIPYWPQLPQRSYLEQMYLQFSEHLPGEVITPERLYIDRSENSISHIEKFYNDYLSDDIYSFSLSKERALGFYALLDAIKLKDKISAVKGQVTGAISFGLQITDHRRNIIFYDDMIRDILIKNVIRISQWQKEELSKINPNVIIFIDEPCLDSIDNKQLKISRDEVISYINELVEEIQATIGIHCCGKTDWTMLMESDVNIISFNAYSFFPEFLLTVDSLKNFLDKGGMIAWGIVPVIENLLLTETIDSLYARMIKIIESFEKTQIDRDKLLSSSFITSVCGMGVMQMKEAEKVSLFVKEISNRIRERFKL